MRISRALYKGKSLALVCEKDLSCYLKDIEGVDIFEDKEQEAMLEVLFPDQKDWLFTQLEVVYNLFQDHSWTGGNGEPF